ncbi:hypothetical protein MMC29_007562 [Sticta canariensis]|nr:hypothetical protein [Sticta canariensis]
MRPRTLVLLAVSVFSHLATAAVIRHGPFARYVSEQDTSQLPRTQLIQRRSGNFIRSFNQSSIPPAAAEQRPGSISDSSAAAASTLPTLTPSLEPNPLPLAQAASVSSILPSKQVGSVPAVGNGPGAASIESSALTTSVTRPSSSAALPPSTTSKPSPTAAISSPTDGGPSIAATTKQVGSVPAVGNGPGAASVESSATTTLSTEKSIETLPSVALPSSVTPTPSSATASSSTSGSASQSPLTTKTTSAALPSSETPIPSSATASSPTSGSASQSPLTTKTKNSSTTSTSFSRLFTLGPVVGSETTSPSASETPQGQPSSLSPSAPSAPSGVIVSSSSVSLISSPGQSLTPTITDIPLSTDAPGQDENIKVAKLFNSYFDSMNPDSGCDAALNSEAAACINKQFATCGNDKKYVLTRCGEGQECRALPMDNGSRGIYIQCIKPSEAAAKLSPGQSSNISSTATSSTPPSSQPEKPSETGFSSGATSLPAIILPSAAEPTFSFGPTPPEDKSSSSSSLAVATPTSNNAGSPGSTFPSTTENKTTASASVISVSTTLLTSTKPKNPAPASEASTTPPAQPSASDVPDGSDSGISIIPVPRISDNAAKPTSTGALPGVVNAAADSVTTGNPFLPGSLVTVRETVTVTTTVHDQR